MRKLGREFVVFLGRLWMGRYEARWGAGISYCEGHRKWERARCLWNGGRKMHTARRFRMDKTRDITSQRERSDTEREESAG